MNWVDVIIVIFLVFSLIGGFVSGLINSVMSIIGLIAGIWLAGHFYVAFSGVFGFIPSETAARVIAFIIILLVVVIVAAIIGRILTKIASSLLLGLLNRLGGAALGVVAGAFFVGLILAVWINFFGVPSVIQDSKLAGFLLRGIPVVINLLPSEFDFIKSLFP